MSNILKKVTVKGVVGDPKNIAKQHENNAQVPLVRVYGLATEFKAKNSEYGDYILFSGQFEATNLLTGEVYRSGSMILPPVAEGPLHGALENTEGTSVQFAYEIGLRVDEEMIRGYEFNVKSLIPDDDHDPLSQLRAQLPPAE